MNKEKTLTEYVDPNDLNTHPDFNPNIDDKFIELMQSAMEGETPVFYAAVPLCICIPFDIDYRPDKPEIGKQLIEEYYQGFENNDFPPLIVYPNGKWFIVSDDYMKLFAYLRGNPTHVPCYIMGDTDNNLIQNKQGPINPKDLGKIFGFE